MKLVIDLSELAAVLVGLRAGTVYISKTGGGFGDFGLRWVVVLEDSSCFTN
jgi:hypothetical protein